MERMELLKRILSEADISREQINLLVKDVILANTKEKKQKFNIYAFTNKNAYRDQFKGVFSKDGFIYATNSYAAVCVKDSYIPEHENKTIDAKGNILDCEPLNYKSAIPSKFEQISFSIPKIKELIKEATLCKDVLYLGKIGGKLFSISNLKLVSMFVESFGAEVIGETNDCIFIKAGENWLLCAKMCPKDADFKIVDLN